MRADDASVRAMHDDPRAFAIRDEESRATAVQRDGVCGVEYDGVAEYDDVAYDDAFVDASFVSPSLHSPTYAPEASNRAILDAQYPSATQKELSSATATSVGMQNPSAPLPGSSFAPYAATRSPVSASYRITWCSPASTIHTSPSGPRVNPWGM